MATARPRLCDVSTAGAATVPHMPRFSLHPARCLTRGRYGQCRAGGDRMPFASPPDSTRLTVPYPGYAEEHEVFAAAFAHALNDSKPTCLQIEGLQEFAGSLWERRRHIPSMATDPLTHVFMEFDVDDDGRLTAGEIAAALQSRGVKVSVPQIQTAIDAYETRKDSEFISLQEWPDFVFALAASDLKKNHDLSILNSTSSSSMDDEGF